jgi:hypothetical protein
MNYPWSHLIDYAWPRFIKYVDAREPLGCWPWLGGKSSGQGNKAPYGTFNIYTPEASFAVRAHIFSCEAAGLDIPKGFHRDHLCVDTLCVNSLHFEATTPRENSLRRWRNTPTWRRSLTKSPSSNVHDGDL